jgi:FkbM family methyltransferase
MPTAGDLPSVGENYFEWIDLLEAVAEAGDRFTMVELGAGYGRWLIEAWSALCRIGKSDITLQLIGVEAEPQHFAWMQEHFRANGLDPTWHRLIQAAVSASDGTTLFTMGHAEKWYGQAIVGDQNWHWDAYPEASVQEVTAVSLATVLEGVPFVDLLDMDIQGVEGEVVTSSRQLLDERIKRVHIGTHSAAVEALLRTTFDQMGWKCTADYPHGGLANTPYGRVQFGDGVQSWVNPRFKAVQRWRTVN